MPLSSDQAALFISQSGETADTLASLRYCEQAGLKIGAIVNASESTIAREADAVFPIIAGPEIGVASTKAFTCQLAVLASDRTSTRLNSSHYCSSRTPSSASEK